MKEIILKGGQIAMVDDTDYDYLNQWKWFLAKRKNNLYAARKDGEKTILIHRQILGIVEKNILADHRDRNGLNNQRENLRIATRSQNNSNKKPSGISKYLGVFFIKKAKKRKWYSQIVKDKKKTFIGTFETEEQAAIAYNNIAIKIHGEFANLNVVND